MLFIYLVTLYFVPVSVTAIKPSSVAMAPVASSDPPSIWESTVTIVGISLCGLVVIVVIVFVVYQRVCHKRLHKYAMAAHEESPRRMCKSTSMRSTPSHESHHGIEIEQDMETPLTGHTPNLEKKRARTPGGNSHKSKGSIAVVPPHNVKSFRADIETNRHLSPSAIPHHGDYEPVPQAGSPKKTRHGDHATKQEHASLFKTSPLVKPKVPRSPKVHPSSKSKSHSHSHKKKSHHPSDRSKVDVPLLPKRYDSLGSDTHQRVVMGSDHTPTNSVKSPPSENKGDCATPTNVNIDVLKKPLTKDEGVHKPNDITLKDLGSNSNRAADDNERNGASGTSDNSMNGEGVTPPQLTTSFIENVTKPRRPTSLTESYSKMSLASTGSNPNVEVTKEKSSVTSSDDRQNALPKPDGQSPKSQRNDSVKTGSNSSSPSKRSKTSTPLSTRSGRSDRTDVTGKTKSPARSINTPSDVVELEYDDFIDMDDTYSYFDPIETEKMTWRGVERVKSKTPS